MELILHGTPVNSFADADVVVGNGAEFALPARASLVTWQHYTTVNPASVTIQIQTSLDGVVWNVADSDTTVTGAIKTFETSARFIRARINAETGSGTGLYVVISTKAIG